MSRLRLALVWCLVASGLVACGRANTPAPVAGVIVTPSKTRVAPGGLLDMTYRFDVLPGAVVNGDYKVFVHVANPEGQMLWMDDHDPPIRTSEWKPGQSVQYTRTQFLPTTGLAPGDAVVSVGLYRDGERLPLRGGLAEASDRAYPVATLQLVPESENIFLIYKGGWHPEEFSEDGGRSWTWTQKAATLSFRNPRADVVFVLEFDARPDVFPGAPQQVTVSAGGQTVATFAADTNTVVMKRLTIPAIALGTSDMADIKIEVDRVFVPADLPAGGRDLRPLGLRVYHAYVEGR